MYDLFFLCELQSDHAKLFLSLDDDPQSVIVVSFGFFCISDSSVRLSGLFGDSYGGHLEGELIF